LQSKNTATAAVTPVAKMQGWAEMRSVLTSKEVREVLGDLDIVPLLPELAQALREAKPAKADPAKRVFWFQWPTYDILRGHLKRAGIPHKDGAGRVLHFHSFRKAFASLAAKHGIPLVVVQKILGHSTPALTTNIYTDVRADNRLSPSEQEAELGEDVIPLKIRTQWFALNVTLSSNSLFTSALRDGVKEVRNLQKMAARAGIEPATK
jgi:hypothetical protein